MKRAIIIALGACLLGGCSTDHPTVQVPVQTLLPIPAAATVAAVGPPLDQTWQLNQTARRQVRQIPEIGIPQGGIDPKDQALATLGLQALSIHAARQALAAAEDRVGVLQTQAAQLSSQIKASAIQLQETVAARDAAIAKYHNAWLGGKAWRLIWWVVGIGGTLLIVDVLLSAFTGCGINPFEWLVGLCRFGAGRKGA